jgi:hypothetical protein
MLKQKAYRSPKLLVAVRDAPCMHCGAEDGTVVAAHSNQLRDGKGRGLKASDYRIAALCHICHFQVDQGLLWDREQKREVWDEAHRKTIGWLFDHDLIAIR